MDVCMFVHIYIHTYIQRVAWAVRDRIEARCAHSGHLVCSRQLDQKRGCAGTSGPPIVKQKHKKLTKSLTTVLPRLAGSGRPRGTPREGSTGPTYTLHTRPHTGGRGKPLYLPRYVPEFLHVHEHLPPEVCFAGRVAGRVGLPALHNIPMAYGLVVGGDGARRRRCV